MTATAIFSWTIVLKVKGVVEVKCRVVLCAYGITHAGVRELIDFRQAASESEAMWTALLDSFYRRRLSTDRLEMVGTDGGVGLHRALDTVYPFVPRQRCWAYKMRNVAAKLPRKHQDVCMAQAKDPSTRPTPAARLSCAPNAVRYIDDDDLLSFLECPEDHWKKVRTTNSIERASGRSVEGHGQ